MAPHEMAQESASIGQVTRYNTLSDRVYELIRHALVAGSFLPGQKLTIRKLAGMLGVSATPARDAISRLVSERVLESGANRTVVVPALDTDKLRQIYVMRSALEGVAAELGAERIGAEEVDKLEKVQFALIAAMDRSDYVRVLANNEEFHFGIYRHSGAPMLVDAIQGLWLKLGPSLNLLYPSYNRSRKGVAHHLEAIAALRGRDPGGVRQAIENDIRDGSTELKRALEISGESGGEVDWRALWQSRKAAT